MTCRNFSSHDCSLMIFMLFSISDVDRSLSSCATMNFAWYPCKIFANGTLRKPKMTRGTRPGRAPSFNAQKSVPTAKAS
uniref:Uncharacterized protein n=1 Tax=Arundo donax TaxID=35708 RepID=A0A0A9HC05_ARUDO